MTEAIKEAREEQIAFRKPIEKTPEEKHLTKLIKNYF